MKKKLRTLLLSALLLCGLAAQAADVTVVLEENFDAFTEGSESAPATVDISSYSSNKLRNTLSGWSGSKVYEAGGCLKIGSSGNLRTATTDMSSNGGNLRITFRVKSLDTVGAVDVQLGYNTANTFYLYDNNWTEIELILAGGRSSSYLTFKPNFVVEGILIDDLKVETSTDFLAAPVADIPTRADGTSFTAIWKSVSGATGYLLNVFTLDESGARQYVLQDQAVTGTSYSVTGLDPTKKHYYTVRAVRDNVISKESDVIEVIKVIASLDAPEALEAEAVSANGFTARWNAVDDATRYELNVTRLERLTEDATVNIIDEDFSRVTQGTLTSVAYGATREYLDSYTKQPGWYGYMHCLAAGYMGLFPYGSPATLTTPELDLSANNGQFTVKANMASRNYSGEVAGDTIMVYVYDDDTAVDSAKVTLEGRFTDYELNFDCGTPQTYIMLSYINGTNKGWVDSFVVSQALSAGDVVSTPVGTYDAGTNTSYPLELPLSEDIMYTYNVVAYAPTVIASYYGNYVDEIASEPSNTIEVVLPVTAVDRISAGNSIKAVNGGLDIATTQPTDVAVYSIDGRLVTNRQVNGNTTVNLPAGIYVVKAGRQTAKVVIR